jgi:ribosomal protein S13
MENNSARVIKLYGDGSEQLQNAIKCGLVEGDLRRTVQETIAENKRVRNDNRLLRHRNAELEAIRHNEMETKAHAYEAWSRVSRERRKEKAFAWQMAVAGFVVGVAASSLIIAVGMLVVRS